MGFIDASMEPMLEVFIFETTSLLEQLDEILLQAEKEQNFTSENINEIFRIMHTIKGSSAMMGIENIANLAHKVEDMFFIIRENPSTMSNVADSDSIIFDVVFQASDFFKNEIEAIQSEDFTPTDSSDLVERIKQHIVTMKNSAADTPSNTEVSVPSDSTKPVDDSTHSVRIFFEDGVQMENIRAFMIVNQLRDWCESINYRPEDIETNPETSKYIVENGFIVTFKTSNPQAVLDIIESSLNIKSYEPIEDPDVRPVEYTVTNIDNEIFDVGASIAQNPVQQINNEIQQSKSANKQNLISVNLFKLDQLMDIVGEIVITESMVAGSPDLKGLSLDSFHKATRQLRKLTDELQDTVMSIRMVPMTGVFQKMNRIIRDMSKKLGKNVELITIGDETEVDKSIIDNITDPFMHIIRNAMDHAIESPEERDAAGKPTTGKITMSAQNIAGEIVITIADDGRGLVAEKILAKAKKNGLLTKNESDYSDKEIYSMIMLPGFSTNEVVTEFSGRGVGMDVVRKSMEKVGGSLNVESKRGEGTTFIIKIPLTLAIVDGMELAVGDTVFTMPITSIRQSFKANDPSQVIYDTDGNEMIMIRGVCYQIIRLHEIYNIETEKTNLMDGIVIQVENEQKSVCVFADELLGEQQVVVKPFPSFMSRYDVKSKGLAGCTILGDGSISLILDASNIIMNY